MFIISIQERPMKCSCACCILNWITFNAALADDDVSCPMISDVSYPTMTSLDSDDVIQMVPKRLPHDHPLADRTELIGK